MKRRDAKKKEIRADCSTSRQPIEVDRFLEAAVQISLYYSPKANGHRVLLF
jgi:hypothetical protein